MTKASETLSLSVYTASKSMETKFKEGDLVQHALGFTAVVHEIVDEVKQQNGMVIKLDNDCVAE